MRAWVLGFLFPLRISAFSEPAFTPTRSGPYLSFLCVLCALPSACPERFSRRGTSVSSSFLSLFPGRWSPVAGHFSPYGRFFWFAKNELVRLITNSPKTAQPSIRTIKVLTSAPCTSEQVSLQSLPFIFNYLRPSMQNGCPVFRTPVAQTPQPFLSSIPLPEAAFYPTSYSSGSTRHPSAPQSATRRHSSSR